MKFFIMIKQLIILSFFLVVILIGGSAFANDSPFPSTSNDYGSLTLQYNSPDEILFTYTFNADKNITRAQIAVGDYDFTDFNTTPPSHAPSGAAAIPSLSTTAAIGLIILILIMGIRILSIKKGIAIITILALLTITGSSNSSSISFGDGISWEIIYNINPAQDGSYTISGLNAGKYTYRLLFSSSEEGTTKTDPLTITVSDNEGDWYIGSDLAYGGAKKGTWTMSDGKVLVLGTSPLADIYDPSTQSWTATSTYSTLTPAWGNACKIEGTDKIIFPASSENIAGPTRDTTTLIYDYSNDTWSETGSFINPRWGAEVACMPNGKVLLIGGYLNPDDPANSVEIYDLDTEQWSLATPMNQNRREHKAVVLMDGRVLVIGGYYIDSQSKRIELNTSEVYDPQTDTWTATGQLAESRFSATEAILLADGRVLVAGGYRSYYGFTDTVEIYDPTTNTWSSTNSMDKRKHAFALILMADGRVMAVGGLYQNDKWEQIEGEWSVNIDINSILSTVEIYDPSTGTWSDINQIRYRRGNPFGITLYDGSVMIGGGSGHDTSYTSTEVYFP